MWYMMNYTPSTSSQEQVAESLEIFSSDTPRSGQSKSKNTRGKSSSHGRRMVSYLPSPSGTMSLLSQWITQRQETTSNTSEASEDSSASVEASPVRTSVLRERDLESRKENVRDSGAKCGELLGKFDPITSSWRTLQLSLLGDSTESLQTFPRFGTTWCGELYQLPTLEHGIEEIASGDLELPRSGTGREMHIPTPCCMDAGGGYGDNPRSCTDPEGRTFRGVGLAYLVNHPELYWNREKFPSPTCHDRLGAYTPESLVRKDGKSRMDMLATYVKYRASFPIPGTRGLSNGSKSLAKSDGNFESRLQTLPDFVSCVLEGKNPTDTGDYDKAMERIEAERKKHGKDNYPTPMAGSSRCSNGSGAFSGNDFGESRLKQHLQNFVPYVLEGKDPVDTGRYDEAMDFIQKEREKHGRVQLADTDSE